MGKKAKRRLVYGGSVAAVGLLAGVYLLAGVGQCRRRVRSGLHRHRGARHDDPVGGRHRQDRADHQGRSEVQGERHHRGLRVDVGDVIAPGQVLVELDKETLAARLREARANLQAADAGLRGAEAALEKNIVEAEGPDVQFARRAFERAKALHADRARWPSRASTRRRAPFEVAENRQRSAKSQLVVAHAKVAEAEANVAQSRAAVERAEEELRNATIRSPLRGMVLTRDVEIGSPVSSILNMGSAATLVMTLGDIERVFVRGKVDEADVGRVKLGQPARISVETFKDRSFEGKVTQISPIGVERDNVTTFEVEVSIDNPGSELKANMTANAEIVLEEHPNVADRARGGDRLRRAARTRSSRCRTPPPATAAAASRSSWASAAAPAPQIVSGVKAGDRVLLPR